VRWNVSRMLWSVEYVNAAVGQTLDFDHGRGVDAEKRLVAANRGPRGSLMSSRADFEDVIAWLGSREGRRLRRHFMTPTI
jgi:hypothetical protein